MYQSYVTSQEMYQLGRMYIIINKKVSNPLERMLSLQHACIDALRDDLKWESVLTRCEHHPYHDVGTGLEKMAERVHRPF